MITRFKLFESPDNLWLNGQELDFSDSDAYAFGLYNGKMYISDDGEAHNQIQPEGSYVRRENFLFPGRIWLDSHVISFWRYPTKEELTDVLNSLELVFNEQFPYKHTLNFEDDWYIENGGIYELKDYLNPTNEYEFPDEDTEWKEHIMKIKAKKG